MKRKILGVGLVAGLMAMAGQRAQAVTWGFGDVVNNDQNVESIVFTGTSSQVTFNSTTDTPTGQTANIKVNTGSSVDIGLIGGASTITPPYVNQPSLLGGTDYAAGVSRTTQTLTLWDALGVALSANINWTQINDHVGTPGVPNTAGSLSGTVSLSNISYTGHQADFLGLVHGINPQIIVSYTFSGENRTLDPAGDPGTSLVLDGPKSTTFSGTISFGTVPDGGMTLILLGSALSGIGFMRRRLA